MFSIYLNEPQGSITLGSYDKTLVAHGTEKEGYGIHWFDVVTKDGQWTIKLEDARYGYLTFLKGSANKATFSSNDEFMYLPQEDFNYLAYQWDQKSADVECTKSYCYVNSSCAEVSHEIGPFKLQFDELAYFSVEPDFYMYDGALFDPAYKDMCVFGVMANPDPKVKDTYVLGHSFMRNYLSIFDAKNKRVGLAIHVTSNAAVRATFSGGIIALLAISVAILFPLFILGIYFIVMSYKKKRRARERAMRSQRENNLMTNLTNNERDRD